MTRVSWLVMVAQGVWEDLVRVLRIWVWQGMLLGGWVAKVGGLEAGAWVAIKLAWEYSGVLGDLGAVRWCLGRKTSLPWRT